MIDDAGAQSGDLAADLKAWRQRGAGRGRIQPPCLEQIRAVNARRRHFEQDFARARLRFLDPLQRKRIGRAGILNRDSVHG
jgi:hypothetical protein